SQLGSTTSSFHGRKKGSPVRSGVRLQLSSLGIGDTNALLLFPSHTCLARFSACSHHVVASPAQVCRHEWLRSSRYGSIFSSFFRRETKFHSRGNDYSPPPRLTSKLNFVSAIYGCSFFQIFLKGKFGGS